MFAGASAFNQPLSSFDVSKVISVSVYSLSQTVRIMRPSHFRSQSTFIRWEPCLLVQRTSTRICVVLETTWTSLLVWGICFSALVALTKVNRQVHLDRGVSTARSHRLSREADQCVWTVVCRNNLQGVLGAREEVRGAREERINEVNRGPEAIKSNKSVALQKSNFVALDYCQKDTFLLYPRYGLPW